MADIKFSNEEKEIIVKKIQGYFLEELEQDIKQFDTEFLLDFISREVGVYFYNKGLYDAQSILERKLEYITEGIYELEKITEFQR